MIRTLAAALVTSTCFMALATPAAAQTREYNIPAGSLKSALDAYARQSGRQVIYRSDEIRSARSPGARGTLSADGALNALLAGTGFTIKADSSGAVAIVKPGNGVAAETASSSGDDTSAAGAKATDTAEIVVIGRPELLASNSLNADIPRSRDGAQPYVVFDADTIQRAGATNVEDFLRQNLTSVTAPQSFLPGGTAGSTSQISLRGFGTNETLILIDGRRAGASVAGGVVGQPDVNSIPLAMIERIEVLPTTASGIYGGGATGGVINIILKRNYRGTDVQLTYGNASRLSGSDFRIDVTQGIPLNDGNTNIILAGSYAKRNAVLVGSSGLYERQVRKYFDNIDPESDFFFEFGTTTNFRSLTGPLTLLDGTPLGSIITFVPKNYAGLGSDGGAALVANAGQYNFESADNARGRNRAYSPETELLSSSVVLRHEFSSNFRMFLEAAASRNRTTTPSDPLGLVALAPGVAGNPFQQFVFAFVPTHFDEAVKTKLDNYRLLAGATFDLGSGWKGGADYSWNRSRFEFNAVNQLSPAFAADASSGVLDIFGTGSIDVSDYAAGPFAGGPVNATLRDVTLRLSGPMPIRFPGGKPILSALVEQRNETIGRYRQIDPFAEAVNFPRSQRVRSAYAELTIPVVGEANAVSAINLLELHLAARHDSYKTTGANSSLIVDGAPVTPEFRQTNRVSSTDYTISARYQPIRDITLRASYNTGFLPPSVTQLAPTPPSQLNLSFFGITDPLRGNEAVGLITATTNSTIDVGPEQSKSLSFGAIITPHFLTGLRLSVDWTRIKKTDAILSPSIFNQSDFIALLNAAPGRFTRAAPLPGDPYAVGPITQIEVGLLNASLARTEAVDLAANYDFDIGPDTRASFFGNATYFPTSVVQLFASAPATDRAGVGNAILGTLKWRAVGGARVEHGRLTGVWTARHFDSYYYNIDHLVPQGASTEKASSQTYHDFFLRYDFNEAATRSIEANVKNIFGTLPPFDPTGLFFLSPFGNARGTIFSLTLRASL